MITSITDRPVFAKRWHTPANVVTVRLLEAVGVSNVISFAKASGIQQEIPAELSIALVRLRSPPSN